MWPYIEPSLGVRQILYYWTGYCLSKPLNISLAVKIAYGKHNAWPQLPDTRRCPVNLTSSSSQLGSLHGMQFAFSKSLIRELISRKSLRQTIEIVSKSRVSGGIRQDIVNR